VAIVSSRAVLVLLKPGLLFTAFRVVIIFGGRQFSGCMFVVVVAAEFLAAFPAPAFSTAVAGLEFT
jgi:hypothetical protein